MDSEIMQITNEMLYVSLVVSAVLQAVKRVPAAKRLSGYIPFVSLALGICGAFLWGLSNPVGEGIVIGLLSSGGYQVFKLPTTTTETGDD